MTKIFNFLKITIPTIIIALAISYASAATWSPAPSNPPTNNTPAPINVGPSIGGIHQGKDGGLDINKSLSSPDAVGLNVWGLSNFFGSVKIQDGTQGAGKVLVSDADGKSAWVATSSLGLGAGGGGGSRDVYTTFPDGSTSLTLQSEVGYSEFWRAGPNITSVSFVWSELTDWGDVANRVSSYVDTLFSGTYEIGVYNQITFTRPFSRPPFVSVTPNFIGVNHNQSSESYGPFPIVLNVTTTGFELITDRNGYYMRGGELNPTPGISLPTGTRSYGFRWRASL
ncbi:MAG: H-type lectin domain-containing protein [Candidatus Paceibacterota bacterium]|jgi:hypothetical protein